MLLAACGLVAASCLIANFRSSRKAPVETADEPAAGHALMTKSLDSVTWSNLRKSASTTATPDILRATAQAAAASTDPATQYLAAMLHVRLGQANEARNIFLRLDPGAVPVQHLYLPYRICQEPDASVNPYAARMRVAAEIDALPPLEAARFHAHQGQLSEALRSYLRTDPASWSPHDADALKRIKLIPGLRPDAERIIEGALRSQRLPPEVAASLLDRAPRKIVNEQKNAVRRAVASDKEATRLVVSVLERTLSIRRLFLKREYDKLVEQHGRRNPIAESDEAILLLFLAAVQIKRSDLAESWGHEIKRRTPTEEVEEWVDRLLMGG
jgi:hypothetical protein